MGKFYFKKILFQEGWKKNVKISTDSNGEITEIIENFEGKDCETEVQLAIPGIPNAHSHAFQYAMAGLTEDHSESRSSNFWTWRNEMYNLALNIDPDSLQGIATMLYSEMLKNGYTSVAEFHYLHHDKDGNKYSNVSELGERLLIAAKDAGIHITLVPIFYNKGGFQKKHEPEQKRFISHNSEEYIHLFEKTLKTAEKYKSNVGIGAHSIRAVDEKMLGEINDYNKGKYPFHLHIAEQIKEVDESKKYLGQTPVEWLYNNFKIGINHHLVHATHLTEKETKLICSNNSNVILCPITEGNLADGIFNYNLFQELGGNWCIGSDSNVGLNPFEEIRLLDYTNRLKTNNRDTFKNSKSANSGEIAFQAIYKNGHKAMGDKKSDYFEIGGTMDFLDIDHNHPLISNSSEKNLLNTIIYSTDVRSIISTYTRGTKRGNDLDAKERIIANYNNAIKNIKNY
jgi:formimidoylglutamate deiminase